MIPLRSVRAQSIFKTTSVNAVAKVVTAIVQLAMVPIALGYLGQELYGVWMSIAALVAFLQFTDLGVANALIGLVGQAPANGKYAVAKQLLVRGFFLVGGLAATVGLVCWVGLSELPWLAWLNIASSVRSEAFLAAQVALVMFCLGLVLSLVQQVRLGLLEGHISAGYQIVGQLLNLVLLYVGTKLDVSMPILIILSMAGVQLMQLVNLLALLKKLKALAQTSIEVVTHWSLKAILGQSAPFLIIQIMGLIAVQADVLIVSHYLGSDSVTTYAVTQKLFGMPELMIWVFLISLWPAYANAKAEGDWAWVQQTFKRSLRHLLLLNVSVALVLLFAGNALIEMWTRGAVSPNGALLSGMAAMVVVTTWSANLMALMNGLGMAKFQASVVVVFGLVNLVLSIYLTTLFGISGPIWGTVISRAAMSLFLHLRLQNHLSLQLAPV